MATRIEITASGTYLVWAGDGTKNDANAVFYIKGNGDAYFGGSLTAGALIAQASSGTVSTAATVETGTFTTNGNNKAVTFSLSYHNAGIFSSVMNSTNSAIIRLDRSYNGGAFTEIASASCSGTTESEWDSEHSRWNVFASISGSGSFTDTQAGTGTFNYRVRITNTSGSWPVMLGGPPWSNGTQSLNVRSVEN